MIIVGLEKWPCIGAFPLCHNVSIKYIVKGKVTHQCHLVRGPAQLCIELHADVGVILRLILENMRSLHALRHHPVAAIRGFLNPEIHVGILAW